MMHITIAANKQIMEGALHNVRLHNSKNLIYIPNNLY